MPDGKATHPEELPCTLFLEFNTLGHDLGCGSAEMRHWFCCQCVVKLHACPLCSEQQPPPPPKETQNKDFSKETVRRLASQNIWAPSRPHRRP